MTHRPPEVVVPIGAVHSIAATAEVHHPRHVGEVVARPKHALFLILAVNAEGAFGCRCLARATGDGRCQHNASILPRVEHLAGQVDLNPLSRLVCLCKSGSRIRCPYRCAAGKHEHQRRTRSNECSKKSRCPKAAITHIAFVQVNSTGRPTAAAHSTPQRLCCLHAGGRQSAG